jgi:hypothetical protein
MVVLKIKTSELTFSNGTNMETIPIPGAEIYYQKNFLSPEAATILFNVLRTKCCVSPHSNLHKRRCMVGESYRLE